MHASLASRRRRPWGRVMSDFSGIDPNMDPTALARLLAANSAQGERDRRVMNRVSALVLAHLSKWS